MKIGITGGIGSGKTYVCKIISSLGYPIYDCDSRAKALMSTDKDLISSIKQLIGCDSYNNDGSINKEVIAGFLFANKSNADKMNQLVHPAVKRDFLQWASEQQSECVFMESAILFESKFNDAVDHTVAIYAPAEIRLKRAMQRDNTTKEKIESRMRQQLTEQEILSLSDYQIINDGEADVHSQVLELLSKLKDGKQQYF